MISSLQNEFVKYWVSLKDKRNRQEKGEYLVEGWHIVFEAIKVNAAKLIITCVPFDCEIDIPIVQVTPQVFKKISSIVSPQGVAALCSMPEPEEDYGEKILYLDEVQDPSNAGSILRSAVAFNYDTIIFSSASVDFYNDKFLRAAQGYFFHCKLRRLDNYHKLKDLNLPIIATSLQENSIQLDKMPYLKSHILIIGNEGKGIRKEILDFADHHVIIPMNDNVQSLNASVAAGICMYELNRLSKGE